MEYDIDCLLIGHNEVEFCKQVEIVSQMGNQSGAFQDMAANYIYYNKSPYNAKQVYNLFREEKINMDEVFSATIAYLGTYLYKHGYSFHYVKTFQDYKKELSVLLMEKKIGVVGITTTLYVSIFPILEIIKFVRKYNHNVKIVVGGPFVTTQYKSLDDKSLQYLFEEIGADFYINAAQGETALVNIIKAIKENLSYSDIDNIFYKNGNSFYYKQFKPENNVLSENMIQWDLFSDVGQYVNVRTSISCPFSCAFCAFPEHAGKYQVASVEQIEKELDAIDCKKVVKSIFFVDDTLNVPQKRFSDLLELLIRKKYNFNWYSHYRCQFATEDEVKKMKESGCEAVFLGIESGSNRILKNMNKKVTVEQLKRGIELLHKYGILIQASFIIGYPGETEQSIQETIEFINSTPIDFYRIQLWYCDTTTKVYKEEKNKYEIVGSQFEWKHKTMDSKTAMNFLKNITLNMKKSIRIPNYFDIDAVIRLKNSGVSIEKIKEYLGIFNECIKDKILYGDYEDISERRKRQFRESLSDLKSEEILLKYDDNLISDFDFEF